MTDTLNAWQVAYLRAIKTGMRPADAMAQCGVDLAAFSEARMNNPAFAAAIELSESGVGATEITAAELLRLREAQVSEKRCAAWFGMTVAEFRTALDADGKLKGAYIMGPERGQANIQVAQYDRAIMGDGNMLKHLGEHHLDQKPAAGNMVLSLEGVNEMIAKLESQLSTRGVALPVLEGDFVEVAEGDDGNVRSVRSVRSGEENGKETEE